MWMWVKKNLKNPKYHPRCNCSPNMNTNGAVVAENGPIEVGSMDFGPWKAPEPPF